ncbi:legumain-like [Lampris incognitus]|uniref:legumain-like n=1 Tax=Lampris incognitus TaxID=2546036 RepID=UPI0024B5E73F|nr:legumain-like [Lampris incognitus]
MEPRDLTKGPDVTVAERILASVVEIIERSCDSEAQALRVQRAHRSDLTCYASYIQVLERYQRNCFDWTDPKYQAAKDYLYLFVSLCEEGIPLDRSTIIYM